MLLMDKIATLLALCDIGFVAVLGAEDERIRFAGRDEGGGWRFGGIMLSITN